MRCATPHFHWVGNELMDQTPKFQMTVSGGFIDVSMITGIVVRCYDAILRSLHPIFEIVLMVFPLTK